MTTITAHEQQDIDRANAVGLTPVAFVHGLWLLSSSWDRWRALFEENGYITLAPGWPDDPETVEEAHHDTTQRCSQTRASSRRPTTTSTSSVR
jgi:non-heme chloroperoxidase